MKHRFVSLIMVLITLLALTFSGLGVTTASAATNIALGKTVNCSSVQEGTSCSYVVDGNLSTRWSSILSPSGPEWIYVDLAGVYDITQVILSWENARATAYEIQVSTDASSWTTIYSTSTGSGTQDILTVTGTGRYVRMYGTEHNNPYWGYSLWEFEIDGTLARAVTQAATAVSPTGATLNGKVINVLDNSVTVSFEYGPDTDYGTTVTATQSPVTGIGVFNVSKVLTELTPLTTYHYRIAATSDEGTFYGLDRTFYTVDSPTVTTDAATLITSSGATLNGTVNANNGTSTVTFEYGLDTEYGTTVTADQSPVSGTTSTPVSKFISGLMPNTIYHYRAVAVKDSGIAYGNDNSFTTASCEVITVTNAANNGTGSLRQAITDVCENGTIIFAADYTITLASSLTIDRNMTIDGGINAITISGNNAVQVFNVSSAVTGATLNRLTIQSGYLQPGHGGNINNAGTLLVTDSVISGSWGQVGGGIYNSGTLSLVNSTISGNSSYTGGGIQNTGTMSVANSTFFGNWGQLGGGIYNNGGTLTVVNSTFYSNNSTSGGGIRNNGSLTLTNSTLYGNSGTGLANFGNLNYSNTLIANSSGGDCSNSASISTNIKNLVQDGSCSASLSGSPNIGNPGSYGGSTWSLPLLPGSIAIDTGDATICANVTTVNNLDQRGLPRPIGKCDIGAFESQGFSLTKNNGDNQSTLINTSFINPLEINVTSANGEPVNGGMVTFTAPVDGASATLSGTSATIMDGSVSITATANGTTGPYHVTASSNGANSVDFSLANLDNPILIWNSPSDIAYGTVLSNTQLNASANTPGTFTYTPSAGTILTVGTHTLHVDFVPDDTFSYTNASKDVSITVTQAVPILTWADPADIAYGTPLGEAQLNATANVPGTFNYTPNSGAYLTLGTHTLHVIFTPTDTVNYVPTTKDVSITVTQATPVITWADPTDIVYGTALGSNQLNATANVPGAFTYTPASGTLLSAGVHTLHVDFAPTDTIHYTNASKDVSIAVTQITPVITWADPTDIDYGTPLSATQLNATADVSGTFTYIPASGAFLSAGIHTLHVDFVPTDSLNYTNASRDVSLKVLDHVIFNDVTDGYWARTFIERLFFLNITGGCGNGNYCPDQGTTRAQLAVLLLRAKYGAPYLPPAVGDGSGFNDVPADHWAAAWIKQLAVEGVTGGCGNGNFCPEQVVTRAQMAVFLVKAMYGTGYTPPDATGTVFTDIPADGFAAAFIEQLVADGITGGCGGGNFCPNKYITRAEMAVFLVAAFNLP